MKRNFAELVINKGAWVSPCFHMTITKKACMQHIIQCTVCAERKRKMRRINPAR